MPSQTKPHFSAEDLERLSDLPLTLTVELGRVKIPIQRLLQLNHGSVIELSKIAGTPLDVLINGKLIAEGEVVIINEKFGIRIINIISQKL